MWSKEMIENRTKYYYVVEEIKKLPSVTAGTYLHLGCGKNIYEGWVNVDKYYPDPRIRKEDIYQLSDSDNSVKAIYSSHALEHLPIRHARKAILDWFRVLQHSGKLYLAIPDLEMTMRCILDKNVYFKDRYEWFMYVLFGYQTSCEDLHPTLDAELDMGQFHTCGFTEESISKFLMDAGFQIQTLFHYDGWNTPSMFIEAQKP